MTQKNKEYYMQLPYTIEVTPIRPEEGGGWTACIPLLGRYSCVGDGETYEEAIEDLKESQEDLIESMIAKGLEIPEPTEERAAIKSFALRMPADLYVRIVELAKRDGISVNRFIVETLSKRQEGLDLAQAVDRIRSEIRYGNSELRQVVMACMFRGSAQYITTSPVPLDIPFIKNAVGYFPISTTFQEEQAQDWTSLITDLTRESEAKT
jgi:predicted RNase H-like HicB family nuclease